MADLFLRIIFIILFTVLTILRGYFKIKTHLIQRGIYSKDEGIGIIVIRSLLGIPLLLAMAVYIIDLPGFQWMYIPAPFTVRMIGILFGAEYCTYRENTGAFLPKSISKPRTALRKQKIPGGTSWR